jgi:serine/threonine-protein kinase RsbT
MEKTAVAESIHVPIRTDGDIVTARQNGRALAMEIGLTSSDQAMVATVISELARNILEYAGQGEILLEVVQRGRRRGIVVIAKDEGPGIQDIEQAMQDGYSTHHGLGLGLPGTRRMMDEFSIASEIGKGTLITTTKWARGDV